MGPPAPDSLSPGSLTVRGHGHPCAPEGGRYDRIPQCGHRALPLHVRRAVHRTAEPVHLGGGARDGCGAPRTADAGGVVSGGRAAAEAVLEILCEKGRPARWLGGFCVFRPLRLHAQPALDEVLGMPAQVLIPIRKPFVDARGEIRNLIDAPFTSAAVITSARGAIRGNHYHNTDYHYCWLQSGEMIYCHRPAGSTRRPTRWVIKP